MAGQVVAGLTARPELPLLRWQGPRTNQSPRERPTMRVSPTVLVAVSAVAFPLALTAPLYSLLLLDVLLVPFQGQTQIGGVLLDPSDVIFAALTFGILVRKRLTFQEIRKQVPFFGVWVTLGLLMSVAYLTADKYQQHLTAIHRVIYQVYRFGWKPILFYPLAALFLNSIKGTRHALTAVVLAGNICALMALPQGLRGMKAVGPFGSGNSLGAALVVPFVICFGSIILETSRRSRWFYGLSLLLLGRVLLWAGSRGATAGAVVGTCAVVAVLLAGSRGRSRFLRFVPVGLAAVLILFALKPDLLTRPTVRRAMTISNPMEENTMQWRIENRWGFFWEKALKRPWFGYGTRCGRGAVQKRRSENPTQWVPESARDLRISRHDFVCFVGPVRHGSRNSGVQAASTTAGLVCRASDRCRTRWHPDPQCRRVGLHEHRLGQQRLLASYRPWHDFDETIHFRTECYPRVTRAGGGVGPSPTSNICPRCHHGQSYSSPRGVGSDTQGRSTRNGFEHLH